MRPRAFLIAALVLLAAPYAALAQGDWGGSIQVGATAEGVSIDGGNVTPEQAITLVSNVSVPDRANTTWRVFFNATADGAPIDQLPSEGRPVENGSSTSFAAQIAAPNETGPSQISYTVTVQAQNTTAQTAGNDTGQNGTDGNQTGNQTAAPPTWETVAVQEDAISFSVQSLAPPPGPGLPWGWILGIGALVVAGGGTAYWWTNRDVQIRGQARSSAMQDLEGETFEQPADTEPEVHPQLKILEARAEDVRRMIELAKDRYERGDLTEHQYNTIRERKEAELEEIQGEMDEYR